MVPTIDTTRFGYLMEKMLVLNRPVLFTGPTGVGKVQFYAGYFHRKSEICKVLTARNDKAFRKYLVLVQYIKTLN